MREIVLDAPIGPLHSLTSCTTVVEEAHLARWIDQPVTHIAQVIGQGGTRVFACAIAKYLNKQRLPAHLRVPLN